uniref:Uncharacterized protein n=1 Tax=Rhabditophanes sp. KR3021 TaxID=114890 RepID=A0AC35UDP9_9BILA
MQFLLSVSAVKVIFCFLLATIAILVVLHVKLTRNFCCPKKIAPEIEENALPIVVVQKSSVKAETTFSESIYEEGEAFSEMNKGFINVSLADYDASSQINKSFSSIQFN